MTRDHISVTLCITDSPRLIFVEEAYVAATSIRMCQKASGGIVVTTKSHPGLVSYLAQGLGEGVGGVGSYESGVRNVACKQGI